MKTKLFFSLAVIATAALLFSVFTTSASSLQDLRAKADAAPATYCAPNAGTDCKSHATGNIYPDYTPKPYPEASLEN